MPKFEVSIADATLRQMEEDASKAKAELNLVAHVRTLVAEVRRLAQQVEEKPTLEQANVALAIATAKETTIALSEKATAVLERFLS